MSEGDWETLAWGEFCGQGFNKSGPHPAYAFTVYLEQFCAAWEWFTGLPRAVDAMKGEQ